jgi:hypothetical protein
VGLSESERGAAGGSEPTRREAGCACGQLHAVVRGEPIRVSVCHCLDCQRRTGSAFGFQARFARADVAIEGHSREHRRFSDEGEGRTFHFCPDCGGTLFYVLDSEPEVLAIPVGAFADPGFPPPRHSVWESRAHPWVTVPGDVEHRP